MELEAFRTIITSQGEATLAMLEEAIERCPADAWTVPVGQWPFWMVAYHTLCYVDLYFAASSRAWKPDATLHPKGRQEFRGARPSRQFTREELLAYVTVCRAKLHAALERETPKSLAGTSGFSWMPSSRAELYVYSIRHAAHHVGQLGAVLRREGVGLRWFMVGPRGRLKKKARGAG